MATLKKIAERPDQSPHEPPPLSPVEAKHRRLAAALKAAEGLWKDRKDMPTDGVEYQEQVRS